ncbi:glycoside hydrolase family 9 protein [Gilvimarinus sp. DA14]|uniref:glycoside hydrolase family 9 protein n=1 Tax=Gilvimarinus sp. DA14 TaxID=2956798 RepID=UPI0020B6B8A9|nr:glycoside hydrolase family 9 protein [Gilvimarinus sp. DA14]UTF60263.1 glycoside hydrolase family 9 protein [Gilvimarinus sp. DA14]
MKTLSLKAAVAFCSACVLTACGSSGGTSNPPSNQSSSQSSEAVSSSSSSSAVSSASSSAVTSAGRIKLNQLGYAPQASKVAVVPEVAASQFSVIDTADNSVVYTGDLSAAARWAPANQTVALADFSELQTPGTYRLQVEGAELSDPFEVGGSPYAELNAAAIKAYYYNRASTELLPEHAGTWARAAGHPDTNVLVHESAASTERPAGTAISAPKGWYDAGDFGKYIVNSGISTYTLLAALEHNGDYYADQDLNIPESGNAIPDLLDEAMWNLEWMLDMQDPNDGGVYHKLTTKGFAGAVMPAEGTAQRYVVQKGTAAALNFAAVMATASRVVADYEEVYSGLSDEMLAAAESAWQWAQANPNVAYNQPSDISTGAYGDGSFGDEFAWAAAELYITTGNDDYYQALDLPSQGIGNPGWSYTAALAWMSLAHHRNHLTDAADVSLIESGIKNFADQLAGESEASAYGVALSEGDMYWGSNGGALNKAMMLLQGYRLNGDARYVQAAQALLDYALGRNPTDYSYVTGFGERPPMHIHHRQSEADGIVDPVPGFLAGGPNTDAQNDCGADQYPAGNEAKARAYLDHWCSYSTNEVTINWNAPLVYVSGALDEYYGE